MEKYGVEFDKEKTKTASWNDEPGKCPLCRQSVDSGGACPTHGTEPFEKRPTKKEDEGSNG